MRMMNAWFISLVYFVSNRERSIRVNQFLRPTRGLSMSMLEYLHPNVLLWLLPLQVSEISQAKKPTVCCTVWTRAKSASEIFHKTRDCTDFYRNDRISPTKFCWAQELSLFNFVRFSHVSNKTGREVMLSVIRIQVPVNTKASYDMMNNALP